MQNKSRYILISFLWLILGSTVIFSASNSVYAFAGYTSNPGFSLYESQSRQKEIDAQLPDTSIILAYKNNPDFIYNDVPPKSESLFYYILDKIISVLDAILSTPLGNFLFKAALYLLIILVVFLLINQLLGGKLGGFVKIGDSGKNFDLQITQEELDTLDFDKLYKQALEKSDYTAATRYAYLSVLKLLDRNKLIVFKPEKTNSDYIRETKNYGFANAFKILTRLYEYSNYGNFKLDKTSFSQVGKNRDIINSELAT